MVKSLRAVRIVTMALVAVAALIAVIVSPVPSLAQSDEFSIDESLRKPLVWNGADTPIAEQPWMAAVVSFNPFAPSACGAFLVRDDWVMTAAHCVENDAISNLLVIAGATDLEDITQGAARGVAAVHLHPGHIAGPDGLDIALLQLDSPFTESNIGIINLASPADRRGATSASLSGWGEINDAGDPSFDQLRRATMTILPNETCSATMNAYAISVGAAPQLDVLPTEMCTAPSSVDGAPCPGDSGSPLVLNADTGIPLAVGVVSWAIGCTELPAVYVDISTVRSWISTILPEGPRCSGLVPTLFAAPGVATSATDGSDVIWGTEGDDVIHARGGNDLVCGLGGDDVIVGGDGNDIVFGNSGDDRLIGSIGADYLVGGPGNDSLLGGSGDDRLFGVSGADVIRGDDGNDILWGFSGDDKMFGGNGDDFFAGHAGDDLMLGEGGNDRLFGGRGADELLGGPGSDVVSGGPQNDVVTGGPGNDVLSGNTGNDTLAGQAGNDVLRGGEQDDRLLGGPDVDECNGGPNVDIADADCETQTQIP